MSRVALELISQCLSFSCRHLLLVAYHVGKIECFSGCLIASSAIQMNPRFRGVNLDRPKDDADVCWDFDLKIPAVFPHYYRASQGYRDTCNINNGAQHFACQHGTLTD